jgi:hypothetical protein
MYPPSVLKLPTTERPVLHQSQIDRYLSHTPYSPRYVPSATEVTSRITKNRKSFHVIHKPSIPKKPKYYHSYFARTVEENHQLRFEIERQKKVISDFKEIFYELVQENSEHGLEGFTDSLLMEEVVKLLHKFDNREHKTVIEEGDDGTFRETIYLY